ncbi:tetratricopeptide repeat protein [Thalassovita gelatinovora]|uniref:Tetratricopeptide repeat protein n=1 Tax=Thalassovita gelatinovora TaxID=53501 RepID=A0A0P1FYW7_THAGE|nr:heme biosynthesis HemY N-terminal domain-containing protein [Thalassovita gelatinovora]QIZ81017.1 heme biosynthesis protein HemY [Thalassovita gelatinovora]CUH65054.1 tetratricopeptide repeat protein [Thalassovita gelatinovora]SEP87294.1 HemY protein [Thalassovita gelatinovora]
MLWSLIKIVVFVVLVAAAALGAGYLLEMDGGVRIAFGGIEFSLTPLSAVIAFLVLLLSLWLLLKLAALAVAVLKFLNGDETALSRYFDRNRERKGYQALTEGMMALASGEPRVAMHKAARAERYLAQPSLTNLLTAQAAEMAGDSKKAQEVYKRLLQDDKTRFVGVRGIMKQKLSEGDTDTARKLAEKAIALKPKHEETQDTLLQLQAQARDWSGARGTLNLKLKNGSLPRDVHKRRDAVLALSEAKTILTEGSSLEAMEEAIEANRLSPDLVPAAALAARGLIEKQQLRKAAKILKKAWAVHPHPDLAVAFAAIHPDETATERLKRFQPLLHLVPDHRETKLLEAELQIAVEDFPAARRALGDLVEHDPDSRALTIMAAVARGEGASDTVVKGWLARALNAPRGPQWVCDKCHNIHHEWVPVCENCGAFDTLAWKSPPESEVASATSMAMLPLIVGSLEDKSGDTAPEQADLVEDAEILDPVGDDDTPAEGADHPGEDAEK